ncbi:MAG: ABC transporter permease [Salinispira sp.]
MNKGLVLKLVRNFIFGRHGNFSLRRIRGGVIGIACSLVPLVLVFVVANGMISGITMRFIETGTYHLQLIPRDRSNAETIPSEETPALLEELRSIEGIRQAFVEVQGVGLIAGGIGHSGGQIRGVDPQIYDSDPNFSRYIEIVAGSFDLTGRRKILLGENLASTLQIGVGDDVRLITARTSDRIIPRVSHFTVSGIVSSGYRDLDSLWIFVNATDARRVIPRDEAQEIIGIKVDNPFSLTSESRELEFIQTRAGAEDAVSDAIRSLTYEHWRLLTWFDLEKNQYRSFITTRNVLLFITVLIVLIAAVNISSAMIMLVLEKQEEIAMLKALGIQNRHIFTVFLIGGGITGGIGAVIGLSLGALATYYVNEIVKFLERVINGVGYIGTVLSSPGELYVPFELFNPDFYLTRIPVNLHFADLAVMGLITLFLSILMSCLPARRAVRLKPIALMHHY